MDGLRPLSAPSPARSPRARASRLGRLAYRLYFAPMGQLRRCVREGGPWQQRRTRVGRARMTAAARDLPRPSFAGEPIVVHVLTGTRFWDLTAFCLWSLSCAARRPLHPVVYDDGSLSLDEATVLCRTFPECEVRSKREIEERLDQHLPAARFPALRGRRLTYPNLRKLTDVHAGERGWKLVIDSDLLFFRTPRFLLDWLRFPERPFHAVDIETAYGYSHAVLERLAGTTLADRLNVGLCGLDSASVDWDRVERYVRVLEEREGTHYYLEQALVALLLAGKACDVAPAVDYVTLPRLPEATRCEAVMHHYVAESKRWYFQRNWRVALEAGCRAIAEVVAR
jgi:hypothetical protein